MAMGVTTGGMGERFPWFEIPGDVPQEIVIFREQFLNIYHFFRFSNISKKVGEFEKKSEFWGKWF